MIALAEEDLAEATEHLLESVSALTELGHIFHAVPRAILSYVARAQGNDQLAREYLANALRTGIGFRSISPIIYCLPVAALLTAGDGNAEYAAELYSLAQQFGHIVNSCWFDEIAGRKLDDLVIALPPEIASAAKSRGRELDIWVTAERLLEELTPT
jgi:hypothetical protein